MKRIILIAAVCALPTGCSILTAGQYVGGPDRCKVGSDWGCHLWVKNGYTVNGDGVNLRVINKEIGGGKTPSVINEM